jgi:phage FluMu protein Com
MSIEKILEIQFKPALDWGRNAKIKLVVHCSCGKNYLIKEKLPEWMTKVRYILPSKCPKCKNVSYIKHSLSAGHKGSDYLPEIVTDEVMKKEE